MVTIFLFKMQVWRILCKDNICPHANIKEHWNKAIEHLLVKRAKTV